MIKEYLAITIGPIDKTIAKASKAQEVWVSSYMFSYLMGLLLMEISSRKIGRIILPNIALLENEKTYYGAGVFNDRCIVELDKKFDISDFESLRNRVIEDFLTGKQLKSFAEPEDPRSGRDTEDTRQSLKLSAETLKDYLQIYGLVTAFDVEKDSIINKINNLLNGLERQLVYQSKNNTTVEQIFNNVTWFYPLGFVPDNKDTKKPDNWENKRTHCVAHINVDNIKQYYEWIGNDWDKAGIFNNCLMTIAKESAKIVRDFGGLPFFMAGDDLFFLAPMLTTVKDVNYNIFDLIQILDFLFKDVFSKNNIQPPTFSCGIFISNNKYHLADAISNSKDLLSKAKNMPSKNSLAVQLAYSGGKTCSATFNKNKNASFDDFIELLKDFPTKEYYVSSVRKKIHDNLTLLKAIGKDNPPDYSGFFNNELMMTGIENNSKRLFLDRSSKIFTAIFKEQKSRYTVQKTLLDDETIAKAGEEAVRQLDSIYKLLDFLIHPEHV